MATALLTNNDGKPGANVLGGGFARFPVSARPSVVVSFPGGRKRLPRFMHRDGHPSPRFMDNMEQEPIPMLEQIDRILSRIQESTDADEIRADLSRLVMFAAEPCAPGETVKQRFERAAKRLGLSPDRTRKYWYGEAMGIPSHEVNKVRIKARAHLARVRRIDALRSEIRALNDDLEGAVHVGAE